MKLSLGALLTFAILASSCQKETATKNSIIGIWESLGSGLFLGIKDSTSYSFYDITSISCLPNRKGELNDIQESLKNDTLFLTEGILIYKFLRINKLPELCTTILTEKRKIDPLCESGVEIKKNAEVAKRVIFENGRFQTNRTLLLHLRVL